jgi:hypothetical protein
MQPAYERNEIGRSCEAVNYRRGEALRARPILRQDGCPSGGHLPSRLDTGHTENGFQAMLELGGRQSRSNK